MSATLNIHEAAAYLGRKQQAVRRLVAKGLLGATLDGQAYRFDMAELERVKKSAYPNGMTHGQIARKYGIKRTSVIYHFRDVPTIGSHQGSAGQHGHAAVYDTATVTEIAQRLEWGEHQHKSQIDES